MSSKGWIKVNAWGSTVISALTIVSALYLLVSLTKQGRGKLRVRFLTGMVVSDLLLGVAAIIPEARYISGKPMIAGSAGCNAQAFLLTVILFTQHLWILCIALTTFLLLKYPLSRITRFLEIYSWTAAPIIWGIACLKSGLYWKYIGWSSSGNLCYYGPHILPSGVDSRDLVQFIPRAFVFIFICCLYSTLFNFLRRPDTIQLSSQFVSGGVQVTGEEDTAGPSQLVKKVLHKSRPAMKRSPSEVGRTSRIASVNPDAPWEQLEFVQVGHTSSWLKPSSPTQSHVSHFDPISSRTQQGGILQPSRPSSPPITDIKDPLFAPPSARPSLVRHSSTSSTDNPSGHGDLETLVTPEMQYSASQQHLIEPDIHQLGANTGNRHQALSPVLSEYEAEGKVSDTLAVPTSFNGDGPEGRRTSGQTLKEFFDEFQVGNPALDAERGAATGLGASGGKAGVPISATAYFNRQASLLMLYFPLAYLIVFSISLVRLIYDMVHEKPSPILTTFSAWMVLSIGLIDGLVYGLAEFIVRRRVRRKMPDRL